MSYEIGTATDYKDLLSKVKTFLTTTLPEAQRWTVKRWNTDLGGIGEYELILCGPGSGSDKIYVGMQTYSSAGGDYYNWRLNGFTGYSPEAAFADQPGAGPDVTDNFSPRLCLWNQSMPYWIVADGRRFVLVAKVSTVYQPCYMGFLLPYGLPNEMPYPLAVGGSRPGNPSYERWSSQDNEHRGFPDPGGGSGITAINAALRVLHGSWLPVANFGGDTNAQVQNNINVWPYVTFKDTSSPHFPYIRWRELDKNIDGSYPVFPLIVVGNSPVINFYGELQSCFALPGQGLATEDTLTIESDTYVVFQNVYRNGTHNYWAMKLE